MLHRHLQATPQLLQPTLRLLKVRIEPTSFPMQSLPWKSFQSLNFAKNFLPLTAYAPPPPSYSSYKRSAAYGSAPAIAEYKPTQPEYSQPQYSAYQINPGFMNAGYGQASSAYAPGNYQIRLDYYTNAKNNHANGAHYKPGTRICLISSKA